MLDVHALHVFYEAARAGSFTAAARVLNMSQPAVSMQIKSLEDYLQVKLFEREGRYQRPTKVGQSLISYAQQIIELTNSAEERIREAEGQVVGNLTIGASAPSALHILPHLVARFQMLYPGVQVTMPTVSKDELQEHVMRGEYDFGVVGAVTTCDNVSCMPFFQDHIVLAVPSGHPFAQKATISPHDLLNERFICQGPESGCRKAVSDALESYGVDVTQLDISMSMGSPEAIVMAVEHGLGMSFISVLNAAPRLPLGRLAIVEVEGLSLYTQVYLSYSQFYLTNPVQTKFRDFLRHPQTRSLINMLTGGLLT